METAIADILLKMQIPLLSCENITSILSNSLILALTFVCLHLLHTCSGVVLMPEPVKQLVFLEGVSN